MDQTESQARRIQEILTYLVEHPEAKDTIEGVSRWWIKSENSESDEREVKLALDWLLAQGWVSERKTMHHSFYLFNREYLERAIAYINSQK